MDTATMMKLAASRTPAGEAVVEGGMRLSYEDLMASVNRVARGLRDLGVAKGDSVVLVAGNCLDATIVFLGVQALGGVAVPINFRLKSTSLAYHIENSGARVVVLDENGVEGVGGLAQQGVECDAFVLLRSCSLQEQDTGAAQVVDLKTLLELSDAREPDTSIDDDSLSMILYTSGTTGRPKGIPLTHRQSLARIHALYMNHGFRHGDGMRCLGLMPIYHTVGLHAVLLTSLQTNGTYYPVHAFLPSESLSLIDRERITYVFGAPTMFHALIEAPDFDDYDLSSLVDLLYAGASMEPILGERVCEMLGTRLTHIYGNTETYNSLYFRDSLSCPGALVPGIFHRVRIVNMGGLPDEVVGPNVDGELIVDMSSDEAFSGYHGNPDETEKKVRDGWYYTGDAAMRDEQGHIFIRGRTDDMIISGGENIYPAEVTTVLLRHDGVADCAVIGTPHERWGQVVTALVVARDETVTHEELDRFCSQSPLEDFKRPRRFLFVEGIPRNPSGKVVLAEARALADRLVDQGV